jgi:hypothetical protein
MACARCTKYIGSFLLEGPDVMARDSSLCPEPGSYAASCGGRTTIGTKTLTAMTQAIMRKP